MDNFECELLHNLLPFLTVSLAVNLEIVFLMIADADKNEIFRYVQSCHYLEGNQQNISVDTCIKLTHLSDI